MKDLSRRYLTYNCHDILFVTVCTLLMSIPASYEPHHFAKALFLGSFVQSLGYGVLLLFIIKKWPKLEVPFLTLLYLLFCIETYSYIRFESRFNPGILILILQTNYEEVKEFFTVYFLQWSSLLLLFIIVILYAFIVWLLKIAPKNIIHGSIFYLVSSIVAVILCFSFFFIPLPFPLGNNIINEFIISCQFVKNSHDELKTMEKMLDKIIIKPSSNQKHSPIIVLVIGESFNKHHSSLYGYPLITSPHLEAEKQCGRLMVYDNAHTPNNGTSFMMKYLFTLKSCNNHIADSSRYVLMPAVFRKSGYEVAYFDNQYTRSSGGELDYSCGYFLNPQRINNECFTYRNKETTAYDGDFIKRYEKEFRKSAKSLNIIHLKGQHFDAAQRYPAAFAHFTIADIHRSDLSNSERQQIADYDNATLYNDEVLNQIINIFRKEDAVVIYVSDHGEQIYDDNHHYFGRAFGSFKEKSTLRHVYEVPFIIWCSDNFKQYHSKKWLDIQSNTHRYVCIDDTSYLLFEIADIDFNYHQPCRSVINTNYLPHKTIIDDSY